MWKRTTKGKMINANNGLLRPGVPVRRARTLCPEMNRKRTIAIVGRALAWLTLLSGFSATAWTTLALRSVPADNPEYITASYSMYVLIPVFCMIGSVLVFESWAFLRTGIPNPWPTVALIYTTTVSTSAFLLCINTTIQNRQDLLTLRQSLAGPLQLFGACSILAVFGFYAVLLVGQVRQIPFTASFGRFALYIWLLYFCATRLWQPVAVMNHALATMP